MRVECPHGDAACTQAWRSSDGFPRNRSLACVECLFDGDAKDLLLVDAGRLDPRRLQAYTGVA